MSTANLPTHARRGCRSLLIHPNGIKERWISICIRHACSITAILQVGYDILFSNGHLHNTWYMSYLVTLMRKVTRCIWKCIQGIGGGGHRCVHLYLIYLTSYMLTDSSWSLLDGFSSRFNVGCSSAYIRSNVPY